MATACRGNYHDTLCTQFTLGRPILISCVYSCISYGKHYLESLPVQVLDTNLYAPLNKNSENKHSSELCIHKKLIINSVHVVMQSLATSWR